MGSGSADDDSRALLDETSLIDALLVYVEPLADRAHVVVVGDSESSVASRLLELGVHSVAILDPDPARAANASQHAPAGVSIRGLVHDLEVRDGAYDLAVVPDIAELNDARVMIGRLRRAVAPAGAVVAMGRARLDDEGDDIPFASDLGLATLDYAAFYELFATEFDNVSLAGVVPFQGVVFAELGGEEDDAPPVSVDTRLGPTTPPSVFVVVASQRSERPALPALDPYAIIQVTEGDLPPPEVDPTALADIAALELKGDLLAAQLEEARERLTLSELRGAELLARFERAALERDAALTRGMELETVLAASQQTLSQFERRLIATEQLGSERASNTQPLPLEEPPPLEEPLPLEQTPPQGLRAVTPSLDVSALVTRAERAEEALAVAVASLGALQDAAEHTVNLSNIDVGQFRARAEQAEAALANYSEDVARSAEALAHETSTYEERLRERAHVIADLEKELARRGRMIEELVSSLEEARDRDGESSTRFEAAPLSVPPKPVFASAASPSVHENARLADKLDALALEVARREGELTARAWRIKELENENDRLLGEVRAGAERGAGGGGGDEAELARVREELDALRQALTQEHAARLAAESGEELARARSELAHQAALLEQIRGRA